MNVEQILQLIDAVSDSALTELAYEAGGTKLFFKKGKKEVVQTVPASPAVWREKEIPVSAAGEKEAPEAVGPLSEKKVISSPLVGTFYAAPSEDAAPFVKVGDHVEKGKVLAIVEAMKLMNEIESDFDGEIAVVLVQNGDAVEYGQPLFVIA